MLLGVFKPKKSISGLRQDAEGFMDVRSVYFCVLNLAPLTVEPIHIYTSNMISFIIQFVTC